MVCQESAIYLNKDIGRRKQIYTWFGDVVTTNNLQFFIANIRTELRQGNIDNAQTIFIRLVREIISNNFDNLGYILECNIKKFGDTRVITDLFNNIVPIPKKLKPEIRKVKVVPIRPKKPKLIFGVTKTGKRRKGELRTYIVRGKPQLKLRDPKSGKFLRFSKKFKKQLKE